MDQVLQTALFDASWIDSIIAIEGRDPAPGTASVWVLGLPFGANELADEMGCRPYRRTTDQHALARRQDEMTRSLRAEMLTERIARLEIEATAAHEARLAALRERDLLAAELSRVRAAHMALLDQRPPGSS